MTKRFLPRNGIHPFLLIAVLWALLAALVVCAGGCASTTVELTRPDGSRLRAASTTLFTDRGLDEATFGQDVSVKGYKSNTNADALRAVAEGAAKGASLARP